MKFLQNLILLFLLSPAVLSQVTVKTSFDKEKMDLLFSTILEKEKAMGSISIFKNGEEVYQNAFGYADIDKKILADKNTVYRIGSISKTFTTAIIWQLIEEKKLSLNTTLSEFFPTIPNASEINMEHLLRHRSGLFNFTSSPDYTSWMELPMSNENIIARIIENGIIFPPDQKAEYSNTNFLLLSFIAEKIEEKKFSEILYDRIMDPLNLKSTYYGGKINTAKNEAYSYTKSNSWKLSSETDMSIPAGAGAIVSTPTELNLFLNALFKGEVVSSNALDQMKKLVQGFGMGLFEIPFENKKGFGHNGGIDGFISNAVYFPSQNVSLAFTSNAMAMNMNDILIGALSIYNGKNYTIPEFKPTLKLSSSELETYLGVYSSPSFPLKITIAKSETGLTGQATGQPSFPLEAYEIHKFRFDMAGIDLHFFPDESKMILKQGGAEYVLTEE